MVKAVDANDAVDLVRRAGILLESARGPIPNLLELLLKEPIKGNWWSHPKGKFLYSMTRKVRDNPDVLVCRLILGKITYVHRRLWPALVRISRTLPPSRLAWIREDHGASGAHIVVTTPFPQWVTKDIKNQAAVLDEKTALTELGPAISSVGAKPRS